MVKIAAVFMDMDSLFQ